MNSLIRTVLRKPAIPVLALGAALILLGPTTVFAQRGWGHGAYSGRSYSGGGPRYSSGGYSGRSYYGGHGYYSSPGYSTPYARGYYARGYYGRGYSGGYYPGRFYAGRGYFYGGRFWARPYFGVGVGIPFGWGYNLGYGCGYYDGFGYWQPAPCYIYPDVYSGY